ncbi:MAG: [NiFe] hydrogenase metallocenter assembly protein HypF [uncultured Sulfurovum sp.]|uniref:[NiFe] hydrogenase metallocenter assembly protein HypF n=1 Tax=uncultured Sulfurovum sp. TaxID=269237 RepID=A0A6S6SJW5_9BACT|nr:MAG: [NiFe] hydrogenase metallocenter assembly protein HypF [uncultured Sulfurovum sp.]
MYFIFQLEFNSSKTYISDLIHAYSKDVGIELDVFQDSKMITISAKQDDEKLELFLNGLEEILPASLYLGKSKHFFRDEKLFLPTLNEAKLPTNIAPCPTCQKEMFDVSSRRYYYPFTSCNHCGSQHSFLTKYPYTRANSSMKFLVPCKECVDEAKSNSLRLDYPLISCIECGVAIRMLDKETEHLALNKGDFRKLFKVSAYAIAAGKTVLMKTAHGYRKFFNPNKDLDTVKQMAFSSSSSSDGLSKNPYTFSEASKENVELSTLLMASATGFNRHLMLVEQEFNALLSIERPLLRVATKSDEMKNLYGSSALVKYPDDGMTMLLAREVISAGLEYIAYIECDAREEADFLVDFDLPITWQKDTKLFVNQDDKIFISGERIVFPTVVKNVKGMVALAHDLLAVDVEGETIIDSMEKFTGIKGNWVNILDNEGFETGHANEKLIPQFKASMTSVLAEYGKVGEKAIGVHFDGNLNFLYYNGKEIINAVPPIPFESDNLWEKISTLRDGSDRLVGNYKKAYPEIWERLDNLEGDMDIFEVTAITLGLANESFEGISAEALSFLGKGGLQIDTRVKDNRFDNYAFLTSIMSYQLGDVENSYMCYSIYESFGDYIGEIVPQLIEKVNTRTIVLTGETFANQSLYGRIQRTLGQYNPLMSKKFPIGKESAVHGALYL